MIWSKWIVVYFPYGWNQEAKETIVNTSTANGEGIEVTLPLLGLSKQYGSLSPGSAIKSFMEDLRCKILDARSTV